MTLPMPVWVAGQFRTMRDPAAFARRALQLPPSAPVGTTEMTQAYWAFVKASEWFQSLPDRGTTAAVALHLPAPDSSPSRGLQLVDLATTAFAAGHDAYNLLQLAAFQLTLRGAFDPHSRYVDPSGRVVGRNWGRQRPHQTQQLDSSALVTLTQQADGSYARSGPDTAPWAARTRIPISCPPRTTATAATGSHSAAGSMSTCRGPNWRNSSLSTRTSSAATRPRRRSC